MHRRNVILVFLFFAFLVPLSVADTINLTGTVRSFLPYYLPAGTYNGHAGQGNSDFQSPGSLGYETGIVKTTLGTDGKPVYAEAAHPTGTLSTFSQPGSTAAQVFDMWYHDTAGFNLSTQSTIALSETSPGSGVYSYLNSAFFPIDDQLYGNQNLAHNYWFTYELHTTFNFLPATGEFFRFVSDDDMFVFIDGKLEIDLGGVHGPLAGTINLDSLGLTGAEHTMDVFFGERHTSDSVFEMTTSVEDLKSHSEVAEPSMLVLLGSGLAALSGMASRKKQQ